MKTSWTSLGYRALWEVDRRSGFKALRTPRGAVPIPAMIPTWSDWLGAFPPDHALGAVRARAAAGRGHKVEPEERDWHLEPQTGLHWPSSVHWTMAMTTGVGDVRLTWEANRFAHVWDWLADGADAAAAFAEELRSWRRANPFRSGVNWASGQEAALRAMAWLHGAACWGDSLSDAAWRDLVELLYWHGVHIDAELGFAQHAVRNNHLLAESLALAMLGDAFGGFEESERWRQRGLTTFESAVAEQFFDDGGYCQHSHAYHAFALGMLFSAADWFAALRAPLAEVFARSLTFFEAVVEPGGGAPNYGPNDRPRPVDYGGLLGELRRRLGATATLSLPRSATFPKAGLHVLRNRSAAVTLRCGPLAARAGHDDGLHAEIWLGGVPVAVDAGSYSYAGAEHDWFSGARSHNVCRVDGAEPRRRLSRFTWTPGPDPRLLEFDARRGLSSARYDAYSGIRWERTVRLEREQVIVTDVLNPRGSHAPRTFLLHWLLDAAHEDVTVVPGECFTWNIRTPNAHVHLRAEALIGTLETAHVGTLPVWVSPAYGQRALATSVTATATAIAVRFHTTFTGT